jgi:hypothetical protein
MVDVFCIYTCNRIIKPVAIVLRNGEGDEGE